jgi:hypothetical protein
VQTFNWATASLNLPPCWDVNINKEAKVAGLPATNSPWTYSGNTNPINYTITTTNIAQSPLGNSTSANPGWTVTDGFVDPLNQNLASAFYSNSSVTQGHTAPPAQVCVLPGWCWTVPPHNGTSQIGIKNLNPGEDGIWNIQFNGNPVTGEHITNCAKVGIAGKESDLYYSNFDPATPKQDCVKIPVIEVTKIPVQKILDDQTGAGIKAMGPFGFNVSCSPFPLQTTSTSFSLSTDATGQSPIHNIFPVPVLSNSCTITEISKPAVPQAAINACIAKHGAGATAVWQTAGSPTTLTGPFSQNMPTVKVINSLVCVPPPVVKLTINKVVANPKLPDGLSIPALTFPISINCTPAATPNTLPLLAGNASGTGFVYVQAGAVCSVSEPNPPIPPLVYEHCYRQGMTAQWVTTYSPNNPFTVGPNGTTVTITNRWECVPNKDSAQVTVYKYLKGPIDLPRDVLQSLTFTVTANCNPAAAAPNPITIGVGQPAVFNVQLGATCTYTESLPIFPAEMIKYCERQGGVPFWSTPIFNPAPTGTIKKKSEKLEIYNRWDCRKKRQPVDFGIRKTVDTSGLPAGTNVPLQNYTINVSCNPPASANSVVIPAGTTPGSTQISVDAGATCVVSEPVPPMPNVINKYCKDNGFTGAMWNPPTFLPSSTITFGNTGKSVSIKNTWKCVGQPASTKIEITKKLEGPQITSNFPAMTFNINANCSPAATPSIVPITTPATSTFPVTAMNSTTVPYGATCTISEPSLPPLPVEARNHCVALLGAGAYASWEPATFSPSTTLTANTAIQSVTVTNKWKCNAPFVHPWLLTITKTVQGPVGAPAIPATAFVINTNCTTPTTPTSVTVTTATTANGGIAVATGASCSVSEVPPPVPAAATQYCSGLNGGGQIAVWEAPVISPAGPVAGSFPTDPKTVTVTNKWKCIFPTITKKKKPRFKINIGIGGSIGGGGGGKPKDKPRDTPRTDRP